MKDEQQHINDRHIRDGLNNLRPTAPAGSWEQLAQRLDTPAHGPSNEDELLRDKLNGLQPFYHSASWDKLNDRLNNLESDEIFVTKIDAQAPVASVSGWAALAAKLELISARRTAIYCYKFSELCLVLAALLLFWYIYPTEKTYKPTLEYNTAIPLANLEHKKASSANPAAPQGVNAIILGRTAPSKEDEIDYAAVVPVYTTVQSSLPILPLENTIVSNAVTPEIATPIVSKSAVSALPKVDYQLVATADYLPSAEATVQLPSIPTKKARTLYLRPFISPWDFNQIITPKQVVNDIILERDDRVSYGSSVGVLLDVQYKKHAMQYGIIYGNRSYIPTVLKDIEDFVPGEGPIERRDTNYSRIAFQTITLPVAYQRELFNNSNWRLAASVGIAANLNIWATFRKSPTFDQDVLDWTRQTLQPGFGLRSPESRGLPVIDAQDLVYPEQGLLQGGSLLNNLTLSANVGFSIERYLSEKVSFYVAPSFSRSLYFNYRSGAEPFNDRIHNSSVQFGTRILLGRRE